MMKDNRPRHLDLRLIRLPLPAYVSILHRISGALLFFFLPLLLWAFQNSLKSIETYTALVALLQQPFIKLIVIFLLWAFLHHACAGIRFLAIDMDIGVSKALARASSKWVLAASLGLTAVLGAMLW